MQLPTDAHDHRTTTALLSVLDGQTDFADIATNIGEQHSFQAIRPLRTLRQLGLVNWDANQPGTLHPTCEQVWTAC